MSMASAAFIFYTQVAGNITRVLWLVILAIELFALVHCLVQRSDAFAAVGSLSKAGWLAILTGALLLTLACGFISIFGFLAVVAAAVYMLDVRPALRDATDGSGPW